MGYYDSHGPHQGALRVIFQRLPRVVLRRGTRAILLGIRNHLRAALLLLGLLLIIMTILGSRSSADNWDTFSYVTCMLGVRQLLSRRQSNMDIPGGINIYPLERSWSDSSECIPLPTMPSPIICVHRVEIDRFISGAIKAGTVWEVQTVELFQELLRANPTVGVVDIGANIGQYSLLAARMGHQVMAVEPYIKHVRMIHKAVLLNGFHANNFTLVQNAVSDSSRTVYLQFKKDNRGAIRIVESNFRIQKILKNAEENCNPSETSVETITMNDLVPHINFKQVILKIDIEGHECMAMLRSGLFMEKLQIPFVIMEWVFMSQANDEYKIKSVQELVDYMKNYKYQAFTTRKRALIMTGKAWLKWPQDVVWKLSTANFP